MGIVVARLIITMWLLGFIVLFVRGVVGLMDGQKITPGWVALVALWPFALMSKHRSKLTNME